MDSWWQLGEWSGFLGVDLDQHRITCPFRAEPAEHGAGNGSHDYRVLLSAAKLRFAWSQYRPTGLGPRVRMSAGS